MIKKKKEQKIINPKLTALAGFLTAAAFLAYPAQFFKLTAFSVVGLTELRWTGLFPTVLVAPKAQFTPAQMAYMVFFPYAVVVVCVEVLQLAVAKFRASAAASYLLFCQFTFITFLLFSVILLAMSFLFQFTVNAEWDMFFLALNYGFQQRVLAAFSSVFVIFAYIGLVLNRLKNQFSSPELQNN